MPCADARPTQLLLFLRISPPRVNLDPGGRSLRAEWGVFVQTFGLERRAVAQDTAGALNFTRNAQFSVTDAPNSFKDVSTYNNYYELGTGKSDPSTNSQQFHT
jgi:hypothetical protein